MNRKAVPAGRQGIVSVASLVLAVVVVGSVGYALLRGRGRMPGPLAPPPGGSLGCTQEAKLCPDGTAVGRTGPNCEFAACPGEAGTFTVSLGEEFTLRKNQLAKVGDSGLEVEVIAFYNSPCPPRVFCVWEGIGVGLRYRFNGEVRQNVYRARVLVRDFGYQIEIVKTDYETYATLRVEKVPDEEAK